MFKLAGLPGNSETVRIYSIMIVKLLSASNSGNSFSLIISSNFKKCSYSIFPLAPVASSVRCKQLENPSLGDWIFLLKLVDSLLNYLIHLLPVSLATMKSMSILLSTRSSFFNEVEEMFPLLLLLPFTIFIWLFCLCPDADSRIYP